MKRLLGIFTGMVLVVAMGGCGVQRIANPQYEHSHLQTDSTITLDFATPLTLTELQDYARRHQLLIDELRFEYPEFTAGFRFDGRGLAETSDLLLAEHRRFLTFMNTHSDSQLDVPRAVFAQRLDELDRVGLKIPTIVAHLPTARAQSLPSVRVRTDPTQQSGPTTSLTRYPPVPSSINHPSQMWAPYGGTSDVNKSRSYQTFIFNDLSKLGSFFATYEHETHLWDKSFANQTGYWSSNMPAAYLDCGNGSDASVDNFAVGTFAANKLRTYTWYWTYIGLTGVGQSAGASTVTIWAQRGYLYGGSCWNVITQEHAGPLAKHGAPGGMSWQF